MPSASICLVKEINAPQTLVGCFPAEVVVKTFFVFCLALAFLAGTVDAQAKGKRKSGKRSASHARVHHTSKPARAPKVHLHVTPRINVGAPRGSATRPVSSAAPSAPAPLSQPASAVPSASGGLPAAAGRPAPSPAGTAPLPPSLVFPAGAVALCQDGSFANNAATGGVCAGRGGVRNWR